MKKLYDEPVMIILLFGHDAICASPNVTEAEAEWKWGEGELS